MEAHAGETNDEALARLLDPNRTSVREFLEATTHPALSPAQARLLDLMEHHHRITTTAIELANALTDDERDGGLDPGRIARAFAAYRKAKATTTALGKGTKEGTDGELG